MTEIIILLNLKKIKSLVAISLSILSFNASSEIIDISIDKISELRAYYEALNPQESAIFVDFDETIARSVGIFAGTEYQFLGSPDILRTYRETTQDVLLVDNLRDVDFFRKQDKLFIKKVLLEGEDTKIIIQELIDQSAYISVLSALQCDFKKKIFLSEHWGTFLCANKGNVQLKLPYAYANDKAERALDLVIEKFNAEHPIKNIVLIDNSYEFSLQKFKDNIVKYINEEIEKNIENAWLKDVNIVIIHYKYFGNALTPEKLKLEYDDFQEKLSKATSMRSNVTHSMPNLLDCLDSSKKEENAFRMSVTPSFSSSNLLCVVKEDIISSFNSPIIDEARLGSSCEDEALDCFFDNLELKKKSLRCSSDVVEIVDLRSSQEETSY
ncbi:MAG: hypothetical protein Q8L85_09835 [Alphaproteobacteria bacterium]|nr:hypothetical protein [Alphaproteobacteria bacterium]